MSSDIELVIAGRKPHRHVASHADEHPWPLPTRSSPEESRAARLHCAQRVLDGKLPRDQLHDTLGMLGLLP
jgi:hypothetical protein